MEIRVSVRGLVEFILRSGDIDNRRASAPDAMQAGGRIHRMIQKRMGADYHAEVSLRYRYETEKYDVIIEGRADGIITEETETAGRMPELPDGNAMQTMEETEAPVIRKHVSVTIDEIKGTYRDLAKMKQAVPVHLAQIGRASCRERVS